MSNDNDILEKLLLKVLTYRITRNIDKELEIRKITHLDLSRSTGGNTNWFNRTFNELKDIKISTFVKVIVAINNIISEKNNLESIEISTIITQEVLSMASVIIDLSFSDIDYLLKNENDYKRFFVDMKFYVDSLKALNHVVTEEEINVYQQILNRIKEQ